MTPEDILRIEKIVETDSINPWIAILLLVVGLLAGLLSSYTKEKGKNLATKEDIKSLTHQVEEVKREIAEVDRIETIKYQQKSAACLEMLRILDAHLSHSDISKNEAPIEKIDKQFADVESIRKCHNDLLLTIDNQEIIGKFLSLLRNDEKYAFQSLDDLRELVRQELKFKGKLRRDPDNTWIQKGILPNSSN